MVTAGLYRPNVRKVKKSKNDIRADRAAQALQYYGVACVRERGIDQETLISDFLADIRHLCDRLNLDLAQIDRMAHRNYLAELNLR